MPGASESPAHHRVSRTRRPIRPRGRRVGGRGRDILRGFDGNDLLDGRQGNDNTFGVGLSMPLRVFDRNQGELARTTAEIERTQALREAAARRVLAEVDVAITQVTSEWDKLLRLHDVYLPKAQRARDTVEFAYRRGGASLLDFLDAQRTYRETTLEHVRALGNYRTALDRLDAAVGYSGEN